MCVCVCMCVCVHVWAHDTECTQQGIYILYLTILYIRTHACRVYSFRYTAGPSQYQSTHGAGANCYCTHLVSVKGAVKCVWSTPTGFLLHGVRARE